VLGGYIQPALFLLILMDTMAKKLAIVALVSVLFIAAITGYFVLIIQDIQGAHVRVLGGIIPEQVHLSSTGEWYVCVASLLCVTS